MAHFAKINEENIVEQVIVVADGHCCGGNYPTSEPCGQQYLNNIGLQGTWKQTSYNHNFRKRYAGIGYTYNEEYDAFVSPKPFNSWVFDENDCSWVAPKPYPTDGNDYVWNEENLDWELLEFEE